MKTLLKVIMFLFLFFTLYWVISCLVGVVFQTDIIEILRCAEWSAIWTFYGGFTCAYMANDIVNQWFKPKKIYQDKYPRHN